MTDQIQRMLCAWRLTPDMHIFPERGARPAEIEAAQNLLRRALPDELRELHLKYIGGQYVGGNIMLAPILPEELGHCQ